MSKFRLISGSAKTPAEEDLPEAEDAITQRAVRRREAAR